MTELLEMAIDRIRALPPERQDEAAQVLLHMVEDEDVYVLTAEEKVSLAASIAQAERGEFASDEDVEALFAKYAG